jgi:hypothetical protein
MYVNNFKKITKGNTCNKILYSQIIGTDEYYAHKITQYCRYNALDIINNLDVRYINNNNNNDSIVLYGYNYECESSITTYKTKLNENKNIICFDCKINKNNNKKISGLGYLDIKINKLKEYLDSINGYKFYGIYEYDIKLPNHSAPKKCKLIIIPEFDIQAVFSSHITNLDKFISNNNKTRLYKLISCFTFNVYFEIDYIKSIFELDKNTTSHIKKRIIKFYKNILGKYFDESCILIKVVQHKVNNYVYMTSSFRDMINDYNYENYRDVYLNTLELDTLNNSIENNIDITVHSKICIDTSLNEHHECSNVLYDVYMTHKKNMQIGGSRYKDIKSINYFLVHYPLINGSETQFKNNDIKKISINLRKTNMSTIFNNEYNTYLHNKKFKIINYFYKSSNNKIVCSYHLLIIDKITSTYYTVVLENYTGFLLSIDKDLRNMYHNKIYNYNGEFRKTTTNFEYKDYNINYDIGKYPGFFGIKIEKINDINVMNSKFFIVETRELYNKYVLDSIKKSQLDYTILLYLMFMNIIVKYFEKYKAYNTLIDVLINNIKVKDENNCSRICKKIHDCILQNKYMYYLFDKFHMFSDNFIITKKIIDYNDSYILWYFPKFELSNQNEESTIIQISDMIKKLNMLCENFDYIKEDKHDMNSENTKNKKKQYDICSKNINNDELIKNTIMNYTNYVYLYENDFCYNMRHINDKKEEINKLITVFLKHQYNIKIAKIELWKLQKEQYYIFCNYPNAEKYNIFHMQIVSIDEISIYSTKEHPIIARYTTLSNKRMIPLEYINNINTNLADIQLDFSLNYSIIFKNDVSIKRFNRLPLLENAKYKYSKNI